MCSFVRFYLLDFFNTSLEEMYVFKLARRNDTKLKALITVRKGKQDNVCGIWEKSDAVEIL